MLSLSTTITRAQLRAALEYQRYNRILWMFPERGPYARAGYAKHLDFFRAGAGYAERGFIAGNRCGKTESGAFETALHLTGEYPEWWNGKRFPEPIDAWAAGRSSSTTRDIVQAKMLGKIAGVGNVRNIKDIVGLGTGLLPRDTILTVTPRVGVPGAVELVRVRHASGGVSTLGFKSWEQGRDAFAGTERHLVWFDEEPPDDVYVEGVMRTMATGTFPGGIVMLTMTPLDGWSKVVDLFMEEGKRAEGRRYVVQAGWDDCPHLTPQAKDAMLAAIPPYQRDARSKGIPQLGSGAIYPVPETSIVVAPFEIPRHWPRAYGLDVGTNTAAVWGAEDRDTGTLYLYSEYFRTGEEPGVHAATIRGRGAWIPGVIDPASQGSSQIDGRRLIQMYRELGLTLTPAENAVEAGLLELWEAMVAGKIKIFSSLSRWLFEFRKYRRDAKGRVVKEDDHVMDATRYLWLSGRKRAITEPQRKTQAPVPIPTNSRNWMA